MANPGVFQIVNPMDGTVTSMSFPENTGKPQQLQLAHQNQLQMNQFMNQARGPIPFPMYQQHGQGGQGGYQPRGNPQGGRGGGNSPKRGGGNYQHRGAR